MSTHRKKPQGTGPAIPKKTITTVFSQLKHCESVAKRAKLCEHIESNYTHIATKHWIESPCEHFFYFLAMVPFNSQFHILLYYLQIFGDANASREAASKSMPVLYSSNRFKGWESALPCETSLSLGFIRVIDDILDKTSIPWSFEKKRSKLEATFPLFFALLSTPTFFDVKNPNRYTHGR